MPTPFDFSSIGSMLPGLGDIPAKLEKIQKRTATETVTVETGAGMVRIESTANLRVRRVTISPQLQELEDREMTEDLLAAAFNLLVERCREAAARIAAEELGPMASLLQNMPLPMM